MKKFLLLTLFISSIVNAEVKDKWKINAGAMYVTNFETEVRLTPKNFPVGARINTKDQLGMKNDTNVFRAGYYRFTDTHSIDFSYFAVNSNGVRAIDTDIKWTDQEDNENTISTGAKITSYFNMNVYKINYGYSFYHNDKVELTLTAGLHITSIDVGIAAVGTVDGVATSTYSSSSAVTVPLPVAGFRGEYTIIPKHLFVNYKADYFVLNYDGFTGSLTSTALNLEYRFVEHVGIGLGYNANKIYLQSDDGNRQLEVTNDLSGALLYFTYVY